MQLHDLLEIGALQTFQDNFARSAGVSSVILAPDGTPITSFGNPTPFCKLLQSTAEGQKRCTDCFLGMSQQALQSERPEIYRCHVHGGHFVAPIKLNGEHFATMYAGQFISQPFTESELEDIEKAAAEIGADVAQVMAAAKSMRIIPEAEARAHADLLFDIVTMITKMGAQTLEARQAREAQAKSYAQLEEQRNDLHEKLQVITRQRDLIERQQMAIHEMSTPIMKIWDDVLVLPVIGVMDTKRSVDIMNKLLQQIVDTQSKCVIVDVTGVEIVDTKTADYLLKVVRAAGLLGARCVLSGLNPAVAQTLVEIGADLSEVRTLRNLKDALRDCLRYIHSDNGDVVG